MLELDDETSLALSADPAFMAEIEAQFVLELAQTGSLNSLEGGNDGVFDVALMKEIGTQANLICLEQISASLPKPRVPVYIQPVALPQRPQVSQRRQSPFGGLMTLVLGVAALVVCLCVLTSMFGGGSSNPTRWDQRQGHRSSSSTGSMVLPTDTTRYTRAQWATDLLKAIGNSNPAPQTTNWVVGWTDYEIGSGSGAAYNLLNTTQRMAGSWNFNSGGVQNFTSYSQGIHANAIVLENGYYPTLLAALQSNDLASLASPPASVQSELGTWGTGWKSWGFSGAKANQTFS